MTERKKERERRTDKQIEGLTDKHTDGNTDRQTHTQTERQENTGIGRDISVFTWISNSLMFDSSYLWYLKINVHLSSI